MKQNDGLGQGAPDDLERLMNEHPEAYRAAMKGAADLRGRLPKDLSRADESAHVFTLAPPARRPR